MVGKQQRAKAIDCPRNEDTCDVTYFVEHGAVPVGRIVVRCLRRYLHIVERGNVVRFGSANANVSTGLGNQVVRLGDREDRISCG